MNPAAHTATSAGIGGAVMVVFVWLFGLWHVAIPGDVAAAMSTLLAAVIGWFLHTKFAAAARLDVQAKPPAAGPSA